MSRRPEGKSARYRRIRRKLIGRDPHCWYCGVEVVEIERIRGAPKLARLPNEASIEHQFHRLKGERPRQGRLLLACFECNNERNKYSERLAGIEVLHERSGHSRDKKL